jgi:chemotaxis protein MotA
MIDRATVFGLAATVILLAWVMVAGAGYSADVFWRTPSLALVLGGAVLTAVVAFPSLRVRTLGRILANAFRARTRPPGESIVTLVALAEIARRDGLLALEQPAKRLNDDFLRRALEMAVDGYDAATIRSVMQAELESTDLRHTEGKGVLELMARTAPTFGMIGTLIGLVIMLGRMNDPSMIGPGMAVALLTTLYGLIVANVFCWPLAQRLGQRSSEELLAKTIALEGVLGIQAGDHPQVLLQKLRAYVPRDQWGTRVDRSASDRLLAGTDEPVPDAPAIEVDSDRRDDKKLIEAA